ncbi:MAG: hypE, partial [Proteobacteria bacterium]|nr:hypE [Pseudomonadota bacterium]
MTERQADTHVSLAHGNGGRLMRELIEDLFRRHLGNELLDTGADACPVPIFADAGRWMVTTDGFTVDPLEFPGGDIGSLAVHGTVNDLAVSGATPLYLTLNAFIEEGAEMALLDRVVASMARACRECGVNVVAGDTKVLRRGQGGGIYFATTGIGVRPADLNLALDQVRPGDDIVLSGPVGDHGTAVLLAREQFGLSGELRSDAASVLPITEALIAIPGLRFMRDPTRGGLATVAHEIARAAGVTIRLREPAIPVRAVCEILGYDPLFLACEGQVVSVIAAENSQRAVEGLRSLGYGQAAVIGKVCEGRAQVLLETEVGG